MNLTVVFGSAMSGYLAVSIRARKASFCRWYSVTGMSAVGMMLSARIFRYSRSSVQVESRCCLKASMRAYGVGGPLGGDDKRSDVRWDAFYNGS